MTCIVGVAKNGKVYIGADSLGSNGFTKEIRKECKVFKNGEMLNVGSDSKPHWVSKQVWDNIVMKVSEKYYPNTKKSEVRDE